MKKISPLLVAIVSLAWVLVVILSSLNKFSVPIATLKACSRIVFIFLMAFISTSLGKLILEKLTIQIAQPIERLLYGFVTGSLIIGYSFYALGATAGIDIVYYGLIVFVFCGLGWRQFSGTFRDLRFMWQDFRASFSDLSTTLQLLLAADGLVLIGAFIFSLGPPYLYDTLVYHYGFPNYYIQLGHTEYNPHIVMSNYPQLIHHWFLAFLLFDGYLSANLWNFFYLS